LRDDLRDIDWFLSAGRGNQFPRTVVKSAEIASKEWRIADGQRLGTLL